MRLVMEIILVAGFVALVVGVPLVCHLCARSYWKGTACGLLFCMTAWVARIPIMALAGVVLGSLLVLVARSRWKAATTWLIPPALLAWCLAVALTSEQFWVMLLSAPALAPVPAMVGVFVAGFRQDWGAVKWGRIAAIVLAAYSIWWWSELFPTMSGWSEYLSAIPISFDVVILITVPLSFLELSKPEWSAYAAGSVALLALAFAWVDYETTGSHRSLEGQCLGQIHQIMLFAYLFSEAHDGALPDSLSTLSQEYGKDFDERLLSCPAAERRGIPASEDGYEYVGAGLRVSDIKDPGEVPIVFDRAGNHRNHTRSVGFADGGLGEPTERQFRALLLRALLASAYPQATMNELKAQEPWLAKEVAKGK